MRDDIVIVASAREVRTSHCKGDIGTRLCKVVAVIMSSLVVYRLVHAPVMILSGRAKAGFDSPPESRIYIMFPFPLISKDY